MPPSEGFVRPPLLEKIEPILDELSKALGEDKLWVYGLHDRRGKTVRRLSLECLEGDAIELLRRRPCRDIDLSLSLAITLSDARRLLDELGEKHLLVSEKRGGENYYFYRK